MNVLAPGILRNCCLIFNLLHLLHHNHLRGNGDSLIPECSENRWGALLRMELWGIRKKNHHRPDGPFDVLTNTDHSPQTSTAHRLHNTQNSLSSIKRYKLSVGFSCYYKCGSSCNNKSVHCRTAQVLRSSARHLPFSFTLYVFPPVTSIPASFTTSR